MAENAIDAQVIPPELEQELEQLFNWFQTALKRSISVTGQYGQSNKLPWLQHGVKGLMRKLWYGDHPDNPTWRGESFDLRQYARLREHLDKVLDELLILETGDPMAALMQQFKDQIKTLVLKHAVAAKHQQQQQPDRPQPDRPPKPSTDDASEESIPNVELKATNPREQEVLDTINSADPQTRNATLTREMLDGIPQIIKALGEKPGSFKDFVTTLNKAIQDGNYKPTPIMAMIARSPAMQLKLFRVASQHWDKHVEDMPDAESGDAAKPSPYDMEVDEEENQAAKDLQAMKSGDEKEKAYREALDQSKGILTRLLGAVRSQAKGGNEVQEFIEMLRERIKEGQGGSIPPLIRLMIKHSKRSIWENLHANVDRMLKERQG